MNDRNRKISILLINNKITIHALIIYNNIIYLTTVPYYDIYLYRKKSTLNYSLLRYTFLALFYTNLKKLYFLRKIFFNIFKL